MNYKLDEEQAGEMVARYLDGVSSHELGYDYGISPSGVVDYVRRAGYEPRTREENLRNRRNLPSVTKLALSIREGTTLEGLSLRYDVSMSRLREKLHDAGFSAVTGEPTIT